MNLKTSPFAKVFKISPRVAIPINEEEIANKNFIPKDIGFEDNKHSMEQVGIALMKHMPVLLIGETGTGKTSLVRHLAAKTNNAFVRVNHNGGTTVEDLVGRWLINEKGTHWVDGILVEAMKKGYWYLADEINAASAEINFVYHSLLDDDGRVILVEKDHEVVIPHPNFRFFGAMNPPTEYAGTKELNKALLSRFAVAKIDFCPPNVEARIIVNRTGVDEEVAQNMVKFAVDIRASHAKQTVRFVLSTRDLIMWALMYKVYKKYIPSAETSILNKIGEDDYESIKDMLGLNFKALDGIATPEQAKKVVEPEEKKVEVGVPTGTSGNPMNYQTAYNNIKVTGGSGSGGIVGSGGTVGLSGSVNVGSTPPQIEPYDVFANEADDSNKIIEKLEQLRNYIKNP